MTAFIAALPMYDWPEARAETDALWVTYRTWFRSQGIDAPERLVRSNRDLPPVPGGIPGADGSHLAEDPATLPPDELDLHALWLHPDLLFAQACWGPLERGLQRHLRVVGQPSYDGIEGGAGQLYSSAILMRRSLGTAARPRADGAAIVPAASLHGARLAFNARDSMSGRLALDRDLAGLAEPVLFAAEIETGSHRASIRAVAEGRADVCAVDCRSWAMARRFEPAAADLHAVGWTKLRPGLPYVAGRRAPAYTLPPCGKGNR